MNGSGGISLANRGRSVAYAVAEDEQFDALLKMMLAQKQELTRISRQLFDASNPVDEYQSAPAMPGTNSINIPPNYELTERIECICASLPVGITAAQLQLGDRTIPLYSGVATTVQTIVTIPYLGILINRDDERVFSVTGAPTTGFYIGLTGHLFERFGDR